MLKLPHARATFGRCYVEKAHAVVARSTFGSKKCQITWCSDHFLTIGWPFDVGKSARRCGAKHISNSKVSKTEGLKPLFDHLMAIPCQQLQQVQQVQQVQLQQQQQQLQLQQLQQQQQQQSYNFRLSQPENF